MGKNPMAHVKDYFLSRLVEQIDLGIVKGKADAKAHKVKYSQAHKGARI